MLKSVKKKINDIEFIETEEIKCPKQTIFDPRDISLQLGRKGKTSWVGSKCHVMETAVKGEMNLITGMLQQTAHRNDLLILDEVELTNKNHNLEPEKLFADSNYISGEKINEYQNKNRVLMGYIQKDTSKKPENFKLEKFEINFNDYSAICPEGKKSIKTTEIKNGERCIYFGKKDCQKCYNFSKCVGESKATKKVLKISKDHKYVRQRRIDQKEKTYRKEMKVRAQVEGTISELVRFHGLRNAKLKNEDGRQLQFFLSAAALNTKRIIKIMTNGKKIA